MLINLKPLAERGASATRGDPPAAAAAREGGGHHALHAAGAGPHHRGPRQPHAVPVHARGRGSGRARAWVPRLVERLRALPQLADVASDLQDQGLQAYVDIDRDTAGRLGVTPAAIDNALYNAFGQRLISTIFTQTNQYRVVLEVKPEFRSGPAALEDIYVDRVDRRRRCRCPAIAQRDRAAPRRSRSTTSASSRRRPLVQPRARRLARRRGRRDRAAAAGDRPAGQRADALPGRGARVPGLARQHAAADPRRDRRRCTSCSACSTRATSTR